MTALSGLKLVDFGAFIAGPYAARILGDLGATVIKVEPPGGETMRPKDERIFSSHKGQNVVTRGTRDIVVDLKTEEGRSIVHKLISDADVVSQNMRPGVAERLGIGYEDVKKINPSAIYLFSPGFGSTGPRSHLPSFEPLNSAFVGIHYRTGGEGNSPIQSMSLDGFCGLLAACGVMMALIHRQKSGEGQYLDLSQLAAAMYYTSETYKTSDGKIVLLSIQNEREWKRFCADILEDSDYSAKFPDNSTRVKNRKEVDDLVDQVIGRMPHAEVAARMKKAEIAFGTLNEVQDFSNHPVLRRAVISMAAAEIKIPSPPAIFNNKPTELLGNVPELNQHGEEIRAEFAKTES